MSVIDKEVVKTANTLIFKEPDKKEYKRFQKKVVDGLQITELKKEVIKLREEIKHLNVRNSLYVDKLNHLDKLPKEEWIAHNKELKKMKIDSKIGELEQALLEKDKEIKKLKKIERTLIEENLSYKVKLKEL